MGAKPNNRNKKEKKMVGKEVVDVRFGVVAVKKGFITKDKILKALEIQLNEDFSIGKHRLIGKILMDEGLINQVQLEEVLGTLFEMNPKDIIKESPEPST